MVPHSVLAPEAVDQDHIDIKCHGWAHLESGPVKYARREVRVEEFGCVLAAGVRVCGSAEFQIKAGDDTEGSHKGNGGHDVRLAGEEFR